MTPPPTPVWWRRPEIRPLAVLALAFVVSRLAYRALGVHFNVDGLDYSSQLVDPDLLRDRLVESVWYLHAQPPLFNVLVGSVLRWSPLAPGLSLHLVFVAFGAAMTAGLYDLGRQLGLGRWAAAVTTVVVACGPTVVLYENWLAYEYPVATVLVLLTDAAARWARTGRTSALLAIGLLAASATLTRSLLHPLWFVGVVALALLIRRPARWTRPALAALVVPVLLVAGVLVKNQTLFGSSALSSWFGFNLHKVTVDSMPVEVRERLYAQGVLRDIGPPDCEVERPDIPVLAEKYKRDWRGQEPDLIRNWNYDCLRPYFETLRQEAVLAARTEPGWAAKGVVGSYEIWAGPSTFYPGIFPNRIQLDRVESLYRRTVLLDIAWDPPVALPAAWGVQASAPDHRFHVSLTIVLATALAAAAAVVALVRWRRDGLSPARAALLMGAGTITFVTVAGNLFEHGENNRFRFIVEPLTLVIATAVIAALWRRWSARRPTSTSTTSTTDPPEDRTRSARRTAPIP